MVTGVEVLTALVVMLNVALVALAGTSTDPDEGTCAAALLLERVTVAPPLGAGLVSVTVPVEANPPVTLLGFTLTDCKTGLAPAVGAWKAMNREAPWLTAVPQLVEVVRLVWSEDTIW